MNPFFKRICSFFLLFTFSVALYSMYNGNPLTRNGLYFYSSETDKDKRTGLELTPDNNLNFPNGFTMEFDLKFRIEVQNFGYIFRIIANDTLNIDLISDYYLENTGTFLSMIIKQETVTTVAKNDIEEGLLDDWVKIKIKVDPQEKHIIFAINETERMVPFTSKTSRYNIFFGSNTYKNFKATDVAPITVKNIRIYDNEEKLFRFWELSRHGKNYVYDEVNSYKAIATNPYWMIDEHVRWNKHKSVDLQGMYYQYAFDPVGERIFIARGNDVLIYNTRLNECLKSKAVSGNAYNLESNQLLYDPSQDELISYNFRETTLSRFNLNSMAWSYDKQGKTEPEFWHHGKYYLPAKKEIITFGGYGYHKYNGFLHVFSEEKQSWKMADLSDSISPRYLGSMGKFTDHSFLYFGGFGNKSGKQEELPDNFYDLYLIDTDDFTVKKLWNMESVDYQFTNSNSMVIDKERNVFYTLSYLNLKHASSAFLHKYALDEPHYQVVGDTIPYIFNDIESYCDLYINNDSTKLYALMSETTNGNTVATIYSIAYPPMSIEDVIQIKPKSQNYIWLLLMIPVLMLPFYLIRKKKIKQNQIILPDESELSEDLVAAIVPLPQLSPSSVYLLGEFTVINDNGNNIGASFTPTTRQVFLLILMYTLKDGYGVSSNELKKNLWEDKDEASARNVRNVYINKVRSLIKDIAGLEIIKAEGYWKIEIKNDAYCDYAKALQLIYILNNDSFNKSALNELLDIAYRGKLLPYIEVEWLDNFKSDYSNELIDLLIKISKSPELANDYNCLLKIANTILIHDNVEEYAIKLKCYILKQLKGKREVRVCFRKYVEDYEKLYTTKPELTFEELLQFKPE